jgi:hypothetical protein
MTEVFDITSWSRDDDFPFHPVGSQPKEIVICPAIAKHPLVDGRRYIFKTAKRNWQARQFWSEVAAYELGRLVGMAVPPAFVGFDTNQGLYGALIESFIDNSREGQSFQIVHGADLLTRTLKDTKKGRPHNIKTVLRICRGLRPKDKLWHKEVITWWGRTLVFDALIGNSDRHPENWGILLEYRLGELNNFNFSPVYDNGTSFAYEQSDNAILALNTQSGVLRYINRGLHHCSWDLASDARARHIELCQSYLQAHPEAGAQMRSVIQFDLAKLHEVLHGFSGLGANIPFSSARADFVGRLVEARRDQLANVLGE